MICQSVQKLKLLYLYNLGCIGSVHVDVDTPFLIVYVVGDFILPKKLII